MRLRGARSMGTYVGALMRYFHYCTPTRRPPTHPCSDSSPFAVLLPPTVQLEWYTVAAQFANIIFLIIACAVPRGLARSHTFLNGFFMCNAALIIFRATKRITQINAISDGVPPSQALSEGFAYPFTGNPQPYLKAEVAGQIMTAAWNFFLVILISISATGPDMDPSPPHAS